MDRLHNTGGSRRTFVSYHNNCAIAQLTDTVQSTDNVVAYLADVADGLQCALLDNLGAGRVGHVVHEGLDKAGPEAAWQLHHGNQLNALGGRARPEALRTQCAHNVVLNKRKNY